MAGRSAACSRALRGLRRGSCIRHDDTARQRSRHPTARGRSGYKRGRGTRCARSGWGCRRARDLRDRVRWPCATWRGWIDIDEQRLRWRSSNEVHSGGSWLRGYKGQAGGTAAPQVRWNAIRTVGDRELFAAEQLANLASGMVGPWAALVQAHVCLPVRQSAAALAFALVGQSEIVVSVSVGGRESQGASVGFDGFVGTLEFVENITQIEER